MARLIAIVGSAHPLPSLAVALITAGLGVAIGLPTGTALLLGTVVLLNQLSVGLSNDAVDAELDRDSGRIRKPVAAGIVPVRLAFSVGLVVAGLSVALSFGLGVGAAVANAVFLVCGWAYNLRLKRTVLSPLPYLLGFGALPAIVTLSLPHPVLPPWWAVTAGALIGLAAHFANVLTDIDADLVRGVRGLPQLVGARASAIVSVLALLLASLVLILGAGAEGMSWLVGILAVAVAAIGLVVALRRPRSRLLFRLVIAMAALDVVLLIGVGTTLV